MDFYWDDQNLSLLAIVLLQVFDYRTTRRGLDMGLRELNEIVLWLMLHFGTRTGLLIAKLLVPVILVPVFLAGWTYDVPWALPAIAGWYGATVWRNWKEIR